MSEISRREFLEGTGAGLAAAALPSLRARLPAPAPGEPAPAAAPQTVIRILLNGVERRL